MFYNKQLNKINIVDSLEKHSLCVAVMIFNIYLQVNNEYSDSAIDQTCKYKIRINCNSFVSVDSLYNENLHQFLTFGQANDQKII